MRSHGFGSSDLALVPGTGGSAVRWQVQQTAAGPELHLPDGLLVRWTPGTPPRCELTAGAGHAPCDPVMAGTVQLALTLRALAGVDGPAGWQIEAVHGGAGAGEFDIRLRRAGLPSACVASVRLDGTLLGVGCGAAQARPRDGALHVAIGSRSLWQWSAHPAPARTWPRLVVPWQPGGLSATSAAVEAALQVRGLQPVGPGEIELAQTPTGTQFVAVRIPVAAALDADVRAWAPGTIERIVVVPEAAIEQALVPIDRGHGCQIAQVLGPTVEATPARSVVVALRACP